jgi:trehalose-phosphatase
MLGTGPALETFFGKLHGSQTGALILDYDGTLAPFCADRYRAFPYPGVSEGLFRIMQGGRTRVVIVTGRPAEEILPLLGIFPFPEVWGLHGLQRLWADGICKTYPLCDDDRLVLDQATSWLDYQGLLDLAETKRGSIAVHWRGMSQEDASLIAEKVRKGWSRLTAHSRMTLLDFDGGVEIRLNAKNKGDVVRTLLEELAPSMPVAYLGDDRTDEDAFSALRDSGQALTALVRAEWRESEAQVWIRPPKELLEFFERWMDCCQGAR